MKLLSLAAILTSLSLLAGCSTGGGGSRINFTHAGHAGEVFQKFPNAYITSNRDGEYDVILIDDAMRTLHKHDSSKKPLQPMAQAPLQQAIHIHIFWKPMDGAMIHESAITNAIVHWYVFGNEGSRGTDMIHYEGAAFVMVDAGDETAKLTIGDGQVSPRTVKGDLQDPIGVSRIRGNINATRNDTIVRQLLATFQAKATQNDPGWNQLEAASTFDK